MMKTLVAGVLFLFSISVFADKPTLVVGAKNFTENYILGEMIAQIIEDIGEANVSRKFGMGGTGIAYQALTNQEIHFYVDYTGTITRSVLKDPEIKKLDGIRFALEKFKLVMSDPLGFNNTYAIGVNKDFAKENGLKKISDLRRVEDIPIGFSYEFMKRADGYPGLLKHYKVNLSNVRGMEHGLAYEALRRKEIEATDVYSTDAKIEKLNLISLQDDLSFFPKYYAVVLSHRDVIEKFPRTWKAIRKLETAINEDEMIRMNALADIEKQSFTTIAGSFLKKKFSSFRETRGASQAMFAEVWKHTKQHFYLVLLALMASMLVGLPMGIYASSHPKFGHFILLFSGLVQTIPSLALLCFLIPLFGIGTLPALVALFLYGLLPIVVNTYTGLQSLDPRLIESAKTLGLNGFQRLVFVELPLASRMIMGGIRTSAIIGIGTATLAALIGAGGYGAPIVTGLAMNDLQIVLQGAVPAAVMALVAHGVFELVNKVVIPKGIQ